MVSGSLEVSLQVQSMRVREIEREFETAKEEEASATLQLERIHAQQTARVPAAREVTGRDAMRVSSGLAACKRCGQLIEKTMASVWLPKAQVESACSRMFSAIAV